VINFSASSEIKVGRGSQCEVRITDVSVSRHHSSFELIEHSDNKMHLRLNDENSKFGTLVFVSKPIPLKNGIKVFIQVGRSML
jgi:pSer/pThr/pTyr-binding forkhead associated (FHA) protein